MTDEQLRDLKKTIDKATASFKGDITQLEAAIGLAFVSEHMGWKPMMLVHDARTIKKYEEIIQLGRKDFSYRNPNLAPEIGPKASKLVAWELVQKGLSFWRAVRGQEPGVRQPTVRGAKA
ncbi:MAG: hypothetical protein A3G41_05955 [Elusimicrobia bacterium RIFCSPLOWO2_12_FULL_59_9]|nr:MAG: hypothetical protein A3G41_05955 [Elusimicrobia bacterium RIFCSPLOWO2_12_FULL_59_9]